ncbi:hypothetical protein FQZ97_644440 [compost metagenome]
MRKRFQRAVGLLEMVGPFFHHGPQVVVRQALLFNQFSVHRHVLNGPSARGPDDVVRLIRDTPTANPPTLTRWGCQWHFEVELVATLQDLLQSLVKVLLCIKRDILEKRLAGFGLFVLGKFKDGVHIARPSHHSRVSVGLDAAEPCQPLGNLQVILEFDVGPFKRTLLTDVTLDRKVGDHLALVVSDGLDIQQRYV